MSIECSEGHSGLSENIENLFKEAYFTHVLLGRTKKSAKKIQDKLYSELQCMINMSVKGEDYTHHNNFKFNKISKVNNNEDE